MSNAAAQLPLDLNAIRSAVDDAIYLVERVGVTGARDYMARVANTARWSAVRCIVSGLDVEKSREANLAALRRMKHGQEAPALDVATIKRDRGHADALSHYVVEALRLTIKEVAERLTEFTSDDVRDALPAATAESLAAHSNAWGAVFRSMAVAHEIEDTGRVVRSRHEGARKRKVAVWRRANA